MKWKKVGVIIHLIEQTNILFNIIDPFILKFSIPSLRRVTQSEVCEGLRETAGFTITVKASSSFYKESSYYWIMQF